MKVETPGCAHNRNRDAAEKAEKKARVWVTWHWPYRALLRARFSFAKCYYTSSAVFVICIKSLDKYRVMRLLNADNTATGIIRLPRRILSSLRFRVNIIARARARECACVFALLWATEFHGRLFGLWNVPKPRVFAKRLIIIRCYPTRSSPFISYPAGRAQFSWLKEGLIGNNFNALTFPALLYYLSSWDHAVITAARTTSIFL